MSIANPRWLTIAGLILLSVFVSQTAKADIIQLSSDQSFVSGLILRETPDSVTVRVRDAAGRTRERVFARSEISAVIRTIDGSIWNARTENSPDELFRYAEQLASFPADHEAYWQLQRLLSFLLDQPLSDPLREAVVRLQLSSMRPGVARLELDWEQFFQSHDPTVGNRDWQAQLVRQLGAVDRRNLLATLVARRHGASWKESWEAVRRGPIAQASLPTLTRLESWLKDDSVQVHPGLLRMEMLIRGQAVDRSPAWPQQ